MSKRRVVITGLGIVCPVGNNVGDAWKNIINGVSGIAPIDNIDTELQAVKFGGAVKDFDVSQYLSPKEAKKMDVFIHYGMALVFKRLKIVDLRLQNLMLKELALQLELGLAA